MKSRTLTRAAIVAALFLVPLLTGCPDPIQQAQKQLNQNGSLTIADCMKKKTDAEQHACIQAVAQNNEQRLEQQATNAYR